MKRKRRKIFRTPEEYEAWLKKGAEVQAELRRRMALIEDELAAKKKPA